VTSTPPRRPALIDTVAALFVFGGLFGASQLLVGDFVVTGSLPAKGPILGVAAILYAASVILGVFIRIGRYWLPAINLAALFAVAYLPAVGQPVAVALGAAHAAAAVILFRERRWFRAMAAWRAVEAPLRQAVAQPARSRGGAPGSPGEAPAPPGGAPGSERGKVSAKAAGGRRRMSGRR
jgi:hypothetical protein